MGAMTLGWDQADRNATITTAGTTVTYVRDVEGRLRTRAGLATDYRNGFDGPGDSPAFMKTPTNNIAEIIVGLPGGATYFYRNPSFTTSPTRWAYPNLHGDTLVTTDNAGVSVQPLLTNSPDGHQTNGGAGNYLAGSYGWLGQYARATEDLPANGDIIQMGARPYHTGIGRFLSVDPNDPINQNDLNGQRLDSDSDGGGDSFWFFQFGDIPLERSDFSTGAIGCLLAAYGCGGRRGIGFGANISSAVRWTYTLPGYRGRPGVRTATRWDPRFRAPRFPWHCSSNVSIAVSLFYLKCKTVRPRRLCQ